MSLIINWFFAPKRGVLYGDTVSKYIKMEDGTLVINNDNIYTYIIDIKINNIKYENNNIIVKSTTDNTYILHPNKLDKFFLNKFIENQKLWLVKYGFPKDNLNLIKINKK